MKGSNNNIRIIISCNTQGIAQELLLDSDNFFESREFPIALPGLVASDSQDALADLWIQVMDKSMVEDISINLQAEGRTMEFTFSGYQLKDKVLLCGSNKVDEAEEALIEIVQMNNEQQNHIRRAEKKLSNLQIQIEDGEKVEHLLNDFSLLNNELINKQRELAQKNARILQLNNKLKTANESLEMFSYSVSHDIREPVLSIKSILNLLDKFYGDNLDDKARTFINHALDGTQRLDRMIQDLLEYYRASDITSEETVDLNMVVNDVLSLLQQRIEDRGATITTSALPQLQGSATGWKQIFQNLISNAIKFVPDDRRPEINISAHQTDNSWHISVSDNGTGIDPKHQDTIFKHFKRADTNSEYEGTGMGLAIVKKIVENFEGEIKMESEPGKGTEFIISI